MFDFLNFQDPLLGIFIVRITLGSIFIAHGSQKTFGWFGGPGIKNWIAWLSKQNVPKLLAILSAWFEILGGIFLFFGIFSKIGALLIIIDMIGAIYLVHWGKGYFAQNGGYEYALNLIFFAIAILIGGPGKYALLNIF